MGKRIHSELTPMNWDLLVPGSLPTIIFIDNTIIQLSSRHGVIELNSRKVAVFVM